MGLGATLLAPAHAQTLPSFTGTYFGGITGVTLPTPTTENIFASYTSTDATNGLDALSSHYVLTINGNNYSLTPNTTDTFVFSASDGSSVSGIITSLIGSYNGSGQTFQEAFSILTGTGRFLGETGNILASNGTANTAGTQASFQVLGTAPVPEASTTVSFGLLLALALGGLVVAGRRRWA